LELLHKAALYAVLTFVIIGAAISLAGPESVSTSAAETEGAAEKGANNSVEMAATANAEKRSGT